MGLFDVIEQDLKSSSGKTPEPKMNGSDKSRERLETIGLTAKAAEKRLSSEGENVLASGGGVSALKILFEQFKDVLVIILLISTVISACMGEMTEAVAIAVIVVLNAALGFFQQYRTEKTLEALKNMAAPMARVYRDGTLQEIPASHLVRDDVIVLSSGDKVPADARLLSAMSLQIDESILTGESVPVSKNAEAPERSAEETGMVFMGTNVTKGRATAQITHTGMNTRMGSIAGMLGDIEEEDTPLQKKLNELGKYIGIGCLIICAIVAGAGILRGEDPLNMLITGVSLSVAAVPEGLPAVVTIALALAVKRMVRRQALIRKLHAVETLGCASVICSDKTGTITQNKMTVQRLFSAGRYYMLSGEGYDRTGKLTENGIAAAPGRDLYRMLDCAVLCNNAALSSDPKEPPVGDPTEIALLIASEKLGYTVSKILSYYQKLDEDPFDNVKKTMSVTVRSLDGRILRYYKGAPDILIAKCSTVLQNGEAVIISHQKKEQIIAENESMARGALRVIGFAFRELSAVNESDSDDLTFLGLMGMIDPPRKEAKQAIRLCNRAGIRTIMITGDHQTTAAAIASQIGILHRGESVLTGKELDSMSDAELDLMVKKTAVYARVNPGHKLRIVKSLKRHGHVVAMTGDGVNDAPAIKEADIGVSMGIGGSDVAKEASDLILLDDNFATMVAAVEEGRVIYSNIRKFIRYLLACNTGEVLTMFLGILMGLPVVLLPIQILLINLVTDGAPAIALGLEPPENDVMYHRPRRKSDGVFSGGLLTMILFRGFLIGLTTLGVFVTFYRLYHDLETARTAAFLTLVLTQLIHVFECKSEEKTIFTVPYLNNGKLILAVLFSALIVFASIYIPALQPVFGTTSLSAFGLILILIFLLVAPLLSAAVKAAFLRIFRTDDNGGINK